VRTRGGRRVAQAGSGKSRQAPSLSAGWAGKEEKKGAMAGLGVAGSAATLASTAGNSLSEKWLWGKPRKAGGQGEEGRRVRKGMAVRGRLSRRQKGKGGARDVKSKPCLKRRRASGVGCAQGNSEPVAVSLAAAPLWQPANGEA